MLIHQSRIYRADLQANPDVLYVFGDNQARVGNGGQAAEMRGEPNALGVATLRYPGQPWTDETYDHNCHILQTDLRPALVALRQKRTVVFPLDGIGTGFARMPTSAPKTFAFLLSLIEELKNVQV